VEPIARGGWLSKGATVGPFRIGVYDGHGEVRILSVEGGYDRETDGENWWHWVGHKLTMKLHSQHISSKIYQANMKFEFSTRGKQALNVLIHARDGGNRQFQLYSQGDVPTKFEKIIDLPPSEIVEVSIETDGQASRLSEQDPRIAAWIIRNLSITPISQN
jgi:hypothetical protein